MPEDGFNNIIPVLSFLLGLQWADSPWVHTDYSIIWMSSLCDCEYLFFLDHFHSKWSNIEVVNDIISTLSLQNNSICGSDQINNEPDGICDYKTVQLTV